MTNDELMDALHHEVRLETDGMVTTLTIDGVDFSNVSKVEFIQEAREIPVLRIEIPAFDTKVIGSMLVKKKFPDQVAGVWPYVGGWAQGQDEPQPSGIG